MPSKCSAAREQLSAQDASISGWLGSLIENRGLNSGEAAGQTVFHAHWHLIPVHSRGLLGVSPPTAHVLLEDLGNPGINLSSEQCFARKDGIQITLIENGRESALVVTSPVDIA
jgi:diadenosine tetraphosphate (Ap4A) HIT family hydrolase